VVLAPDVLPVAEAVMMLMLITKGLLLAYDFSGFSPGLL
jgi:hypothetical protein